MYSIYTEVHTFTWYVFTTVIINDGHNFSDVCMNTCSIVFICILVHDIRPIFDKSFLLFVYYIYDYIYFVTCIIVI